MQVRLLGPVDVLVEGASRPVPGMRRKAILAVIALHRGDIVSTERLIELAWTGDTGTVVANTIQSHVSQLRRIVGSRTAIQARPPGYRLDAGADATDIEVAERMIRQGERLPLPADRARQARAALALWRDRPMVDIAGLPWLDEQALRLERLRLRATHALIDARLALGEHAQLLPELESMIQENPYDEQLHGQLILSLYRAGRQADALAAYQRLRQALGDDLGIDPGPNLRALEAAILRHDATLDLVPAPTTITATPAQLPLALPGFVGRIEELSVLDARLPRPETTGSSAVVISISGTAGVGKTALAVHWAHRVADRFPDGQLYVNLRGYDPSGSALDPGVAMQGFLSALGIPVERQHADLDDRAALLRTVLAGRRVLLLLDNARDAQQVRPLLPGSPTCLAIVTSRNRLTSLVAAEGAYPIALDLLGVDDAHALLAQRLGAERVAAEPAAMARIAAKCVGLPLALAVAAARAATQADLPLASIASELHDSAGALDALESEDDAIDVRAVFSWSFDTLSPDAARLFRFMSRRGPLVTVPAAASLLGASTVDTRRLLNELTMAHLLIEHASGRYTMHDLLRAYATEQVWERDGELLVRAAVSRLLDHYLHTAHAAATLLHPPGSPFRLDPPLPGVALVRLADAGQANAWFTAERDALLGAVQQMPTVGLDSCVGPLAWSLGIFLDRHGDWAELLTANEAALAATSRLEDRSGQARALRGLAGANTRLGRYDDALGQLGRATGLLQRLGDLGGLARAYLDVGHIYERLGRYADALDQDELALGTFRAAGITAGQGLALNGIAWCHAMLGNYDLAAVHGNEAVALQRETGDAWALAATLDTLGYVRQHSGDHHGAVECFLRAGQLWAEAGDRAGAAETLTHLGDSYAATGDLAAAARAWKDAVDVYEELAHPQADTVRAMLGDLSK